jgi:hypothetical protein
MEQDQNRVPSLKGTAFGIVVDHFRQLVATGRISTEEVEKELTREDREIVGGVVIPVAWYPIDTYTRLMELTVRKLADGDPQSYLRERGRISAERLLGGSYQNYASAAGTWGPRVAQTLMGMGRLVYSFGEWRFREIGPDDFEIEFSGAEPFPDVARWVLLGFIEYAAAAASEGLVVSTERPSRDRITYRVRKSG